MFNKFIQPAHLPTETAPDNADCLVAGWGYTFSGATNGSATLQHVSVPTMPDQQCAESYIGINPVDSAKSAINVDTMFCMGLAEGGKVTVVFLDLSDVQADIRELLLKIKQI